MTCVDFIDLERDKTGGKIIINICYGNFLFILL